MRVVFVDFFLDSFTAVGDLPRSNGLVDVLNGLIPEGGEDREHTYMYRRHVRLARCAGAYE